MRPSWLVALFLILLGLAPLVLPEFTITLANYIGLYALVALGLVLLTGVGGLTSFGQAAFVGLGAYTTAVLTTAELPSWLAWLGASPWLTLPDPAGSYALIAAGSNTRAMNPTMVKPSRGREP